MIEIALGLEEGFLHHVGRTTLGLQSQIEFFVSDVEQVTPARFQGLAHCFRRS